MGEEESFCQHLLEYGGDWFWDNPLIPKGIQWILEVTRRGTLPCMASSSYNKHMLPNISGAG